jgi:broad specificity phosphatase PhoE
VRFPGAQRHDGESAEALAERVLQATRRIAARHPQGSVLIVTHGGPIRAIERAATGESPRVMANCETFQLTSEQLH